MKPSQATREGCGGTRPWGNRKELGKGIEEGMAKGGKGRGRYLICVIVGSIANFKAGLSRIFRPTSHLFAPKASHISICAEFDLSSISA